MARALRLVRKVSGRGENVAWVFDTDGYSGASIGNFSEGADVSTYSVDPQIAAVLQWARFGDAKSITGSALRAAQTSGNPAENEALFVNKLHAAVRNVVDKMEIQFFSGTGASSSMVGLDTALQDDNTYAGVNRHSPANRPTRANVIDPGSPTALTLGQIRSDLSRIENECGSKPPVAFCSFDIGDRAASLMDGYRQYVTNVQNGDDTQDLVWGMDRVLIDGCTFIRNRRATAGSIYYVDPSQIELVVQRPEQVPGDDQGLVMGEDGFGPIGMGLQVKPLAKTGDSHRFLVMSECQLRVLRPNACGIRLNVST